MSVSREVRSFLQKKDLENKRSEKGKVRFFVTDDPESFKTVSRIFLKKNIRVKKVSLS